VNTATKIIIGVLVATGIVVAGLAWHNQESAGPVKPSPSASSQGAATPTPSTQYAVKAYFSKHPQSDNDPSAAFPVGRLSPDAGVSKFAVAQVLAGPTAAETQAGYFSPGITLTGNSTCGGDFSINIAGGVATLQFCRTTALKGSVSDGQLNSELTATLKQFPNVTKVVILNQAGHCLFDASGRDLCKR
jgi:hypothetical protein